MKQVIVIKSRQCGQTNAARQLSEYMEVSFSERKPRSYDGTRPPSIGDPEIEAMERFYKKNPEVLAEVHRLFMPRVCPWPRMTLFLGTSGGNGVDWVREMFVNPTKDKP